MINNSCMNYLALIGDVVDSRHLPKRDAFQVQLAEALKKAGARNATLASPYTITLGDEFQAVYRSAERLFLDLFSIWRDLHPEKVRFAIGVGELSTAINPKQALGMDGPAFHRAREAITVLKKTGYRIRLQGERAPQGPMFDPWNLLNSSFNLVSHEVESWGKNRLHIMCGLLAGRAVAQMEKELGISKVAVYKNINAAALDELKELCDEAALFLNQEIKKK